MRIKKIINQIRRDFYAIYVCEHCDAEEKSSGYDDDNFHQNVIPKMICKQCGNGSPNSYTPCDTKYNSWEEV